MIHTVDRVSNVPMHLFVRSFVRFIVSNTVVIFLYSLLMQVVFVDRVFCYSVISETLMSC